MTEQTDTRARPAPTRDLVLLPGLNNTAAIWQALLPRLPAGVRVHTPEVPALDDVDAIAARLLGGSGPEQTTGAEAATSAGASSERVLPPRFALLGFSFGGYVALAMLAAAAHRIDALALVGTSAQADGDAARANREASIARALAGEYEAMVEANAPRTMAAAALADPALVARRRAMVAAYGATRFIAHTRACIGRPDRSALVAAFDGPLLVTGGAEDLVITPAVQQRLAALNSHARYVPIEGAGHLAPMERPEALAVALAGWLAQEPRR